MSNNSSIEHQFNRGGTITLPSHELNVLSMKWSPDGGMLASGGKDARLKLHRISNGEITLERRKADRTHSNDITQVCWNPRSTKQLATASLDRTVKIWDINSEDAVTSIKSKSENINLSWSNDGNYILSTDRSDLITILDVREPQKVLTSLEEKFQCDIRDISWNKDDDLLFVACGDGRIRILDSKSLQMVYSVEAFGGSCNCLRFDQTGKYFAAGSSDAVSTIWDTENLACIRVVNRCERSIQVACFSHDGRYLATGSEDNFIDIADTRTGDMIIQPQKTNDAADETTAMLAMDFNPRHYILAYCLNWRSDRHRGTIKILGLPEST